jgi:hypothetical protein
MILGIDASSIRGRGGIPTWSSYSARQVSLPTGSPKSSSGAVRAPWIGSKTAFVGEKP